MISLCVRSTRVKFIGVFNANTHTHTDQLICDVYLSAGYSYRQHVRIGHFNCMIKWSATVSPLSATLLLIALSPFLPPYHHSFIKLARVR